MSKRAIISLDEGSMTSGTVINIIETSGDSAIGIRLPLGQLSWSCGENTVGIGYRWNDGVFTDPNRNIDTAKSEKINQLSSICNSNIISGSDILLSDGIAQHFDYTTEDQINISDMFNAVVLGATCYPYQPSNGSCTIYQAQDIVTIYTTLSSLKTKELTYYHQLKDYVNSLTEIEDVDSVYYGQELTGEYLEHYNSTIEIANQQMQQVLSKLYGDINA